MLASPSLSTHCPTPPRHLHSVVVDQGGLWVFSGVLLARTPRTRKKLAHLLMPAWAHVQSSRRTQELDSCRSRGESLGPGPGTVP